MKFLFMMMTLLGFTFTISRAQSTHHSPKADTIWVCPPCSGGCDTIAYHHPGTCPHCGMTLIPGKPPTPKKTPLAIAFYLQNGVEVLDFAGPMEVFVDAGYQVFTVSKTKDPIYAQGVLKIIPDYSIEDAPPSDVLAFFGGNTGPSSNDSTLINWIKSRRPQTTYFFSVCTGAFIAGKAGLLDSLTVTTFHESIQNLSNMVPSAKVLSNARFVDNNWIITTAGISAGIDGALHFVSKMQGPDAAKTVAEYMEYDKWIPEQGVVIR
jgi:transcriptional regulator GlxA family with amidase domain